MNCVGTPVALTPTSDAKDRKELARRQDHDSSDWALSIGAHRGIEKAGPG
jgi:hypothetical protein